MKNLASLFTAAVLVLATSATAQNTTAQNRNAQPHNTISATTATNTITHQNNGVSSTTTTGNVLNNQQREHDLYTNDAQEVDMQILPGSSPGIFIVRAPNNETILSVQVIDFRGTPMPVRIGNFMNKPQDKELDMGFENGAPRHVIVKTTGGIYTKQIVMKR